MKRLAAAVLALCLFLAAVPAMADGAYEFVKTALSTVTTDGNSLGTPYDFSDTVSEVTDATVLHINLPNKFLAICGRNASNRYECKLWSVDNVNQLAGYAAGMLEYFDTIDSARTTANSFMIVVTYGEGDDDMIVVDNATLAQSVADILMSD